MHPSLPAVTPKVSLADAEAIRRAKKAALRRQYRQTLSGKAERARYRLRKASDLDWLAKAAAYRAANRGKWASSDRSYGRRSDVSMNKSARNRAKDLGLPFNLRIRDMPVVPSRCPVLGLPLFRSTFAAGPTGHSPSLDRIVPHLGYVEGNVRVISLRANMIKSNASPLELALVTTDLGVLLAPGFCDGGGI